MTPWSKIELRRTAATMPAGRPKQSANRIAHSDSSTVAGNSADKLLDHRLMRNDRLAEVAVQQTAANRTNTARAPADRSPYSCRRLLVAARRPCRARPAIGFDRIARDEADQNENEQRNPDKGRNDQAYAREYKAEHRAARVDALLDIDPVEGVPAERAELEVDHFLAHRLQLNRMRDGEPGRLFLEDHLRLFVERGAFGLIARRSWPSATRSSNGW